MAYQVNNKINSSKTKTMVLISVLVSQAIVLSYFERFIPLNLLINIPGMKLGLANIVTLVSLYMLNFKQSTFIVITRTALTAVLFGSMSAFIYSLSGGILSLFAMGLVKKVAKDKVSVMGISIVGAAFHNIGQILVAILVVQNTNLIYYLPFLMITSIVTGVLVGITSGYLISYLKIKR